MNLCYHVSGSSSSGYETGSSISDKELVTRTRDHLPRDISQTRVSRVSNRDSIDSGSFIARLKSLNEILSIFNSKFSSFQTQSTIFDS